MKYRRQASSQLGPCVGKKRCRHERGFHKEKQQYGNKIKRASCRQKKRDKTRSSRQAGRR